MPIDFPATHSCPQVKVPRIKVCGVRHVADLEVLAESGVDSVGLNFVAHSPRYVEPTRAAELVSRAQELGLMCVAVVMNLPASQLAHLLDQVAVDWVQLHGVEQPEIATACGGRPILKVTSWSGRAEESELVQSWQPLQHTGQLGGWLVDAYAPAAGGGTGRVARWDLLQPRPKVFGSLPLLLAGGLVPSNVGAAISATRADGVDTASGVELSPGTKSPELVSAFANAARRAWSGT